MSTESEHQVVIDIVPKKGKAYSKSVEVGIMVWSSDLDTMRIILYKDLPCENTCCEEMVFIDLSFVSHAE